VVRLAQPGWETAASAGRAQGTASAPRLSSPEPHAGREDRHQPGAAPDGRALISFERCDVAELEPTIADAGRRSSAARADQATFKAIEQILRAARRSKDITLQQRSIIVLESRRRPRTASPGPRAHRSAPAKVSA
jgi:hypothetical protein